MSDKEYNRRDFLKFSGNLIAGLLGYNIIQGKVSANEIDQLLKWKTYNNSKELFSRAGFPSLRKALEYAKKIDSWEPRDIVSQYYIDLLPKGANEMLHNEFNLDKESLARYNLNFLKEILKNLNPNYNISKPIALALVAKKDIYEGQFDNNLPFFLNIMKSHKLFIYETNNENDFFSAIEKFGSYHGLDQNKDPKKSIALLYISMEGTRTSACLTNDEKYGKYLNVDHDLIFTKLNDRIKSFFDLYEEDFNMKNLTKEKIYNIIDPYFLDIRDEEQMKMVSKYLTHQVILDCCSTGADNNHSENLAYALFNSWENIKLLIAPKDAAFIEKLIQEKDYFIPKYLGPKCEPVKSLILKRA